MISNLELRHIVETAFLPARCLCTIDPTGSMTVQIFQSEAGMEEFTVTGIDSSRLTTSRAIAELVGELKEDMNLQKQGLARQKRKG